MLDVTTILSDPELGATSFIVERTVYKRSAGEVTEQACTTFPVTGCIHPGTPDQLSQLPEEDCREDFIVIYAPTILSLGENNGLIYTGPDRIHWSGQTWRLVKLKPWTAFGFVQGFAVLVQEDQGGGSG